jgi:folate-binding protein YgfZ
MSAPNMSASALVWADLARDVVVVRGKDAGSFLHSQMAQDIASVEIGTSVHSLLLEPTGHLVAMVRVIRHVDDVYSLDVEKGFGQSLIDRLKRFVLRADVALEISDWSVRGFRGLGVENLSFDDHIVATCYWQPEQGVDVVGATALLPQIGDKTEAEHIDMFRVDAQWPQLGTDVLVGDIPGTTGVLSVSVSFTKGCYPGQELVERMDSRGTSAPVVVRAMARDGLGVGSRIQENAKDVGTITSIGFTRALGRCARQSTVGEPLR